MKDAPVRTAVVTGGHSYDVVNFQRLFRGLDGIEPYVQHMDDFASSDEDVRDSYDTVVFYTMLTDGPSDAGNPSELRWRIPITPSPETCRVGRWWMRPTRWPSPAPGAGLCSQ